MKKVIFENLEITNNVSHLLVNGTFKTEGTATNDDVFAAVEGILRGVSNIETHGGEDMRINGDQVTGQIKLI